MTDQPLDDDRWMREALRMAEQNRQAPFGAVLVDRRDHRLAAAGVNRSRQDPTLHGEIAALRDYASRGGSDWRRLTLYTTAEPCCMCQGAALWAGVTEVVFGVSIEELIDLGWRQFRLPAAEVIARSWLPHAVLRGGVLREPCLQLFRQARTSPPA